MTILRSICAALLMAVAMQAGALEIKPYSAQALQAAQQAGQAVALHVRADWCPTCRAQDKVLERLKGDPQLKLTVFSVNYDTEKALCEQLKVDTQSTIIVYRGSKETARMAGKVAPQEIRAALATAL